MRQSPERFLPSGEHVPISGIQYTASYGPQFNAAADGSPSVARGAEVAAYDAARNQVFILGPQGVDVLDATTLEFKLGLPRSDAQPGSPVTLGGGNSVAVFGDVLAVAYDGEERGEDGAVVFYDISGSEPVITRIVTGPDFSTPDQITFTPDGSKLLVAIEAEPGDDYASDARGGVAIIDVATGALTFAGFDAFDDEAAALRAAGVRLTGRATPDGEPNTALPSRDLEPEYIAVNAAGTKAYVALQEANALGILDIASGEFESILSFGLKDHSLAGFGLDASDRDGGPNIRTLPIYGMFQPDGIATFEAGGRTFIVTANEGDAREWGNFEEPIRINDPAVVLDPTAFPAAIAARLKDNAVAGRLEISRHTGDTDGDGDYDQLHVFGGRSVSIFEVTGDGTGLELVWDSGDTIDEVIAAQFPFRYDDTRSDNKGAEPEHLTLATVDGTLQAIVGLERASMLMSFEIDTSAVAEGGDPVGRLSGLLGGGLPTSGGIDGAAEVFTYIPGEGGAPGQVIVPNEVTGTVRQLDLQPATGSTFTLQILHGSDFEAGLAATARAPNFAAIVDALEGSYANSITLSSGDNYIPGPFLAAGTDAGVRAALQAYYEQLFGLAPGALSGLREAPARMDIAILNAIGVEASVFGNHEFDLGTNIVADAIDVIAGSGTGTGRITSIGALFPYLSANLDFAGDAALRTLVTQTLREASSYATTAADLANDNAIGSEAADAQISPWTTIVENGETIGILGATTQILRSISSPGGVEIIGDDVNDMPALAAILQPYVDQMAAQGIDKIILLSHLQQNALELELATLLRGVDVIIAGGSHQVWADETDALRPGDEAGNDYPVFRTGADGNSVAVVNTGSEYSYVGRLVVTFDEDGNIIPDSVDPAISGAYVTTDEGVDAVAGNADGTLSQDERDEIFADGTRGGEVKQLADAVGAVIAAKDGNVFGYSDVFLDGRRIEVRTQETNLGNLTADANLAFARSFDGEVVVSLKNGGGIRAEIGAIVGQPIPAEVPPLPNPEAGKPAGGISQLDIENALRFNNGLAMATFTAANLLAVVENALRGVAPGATPGAFPQVSGLVFSFDGDRPAGERVVTLAVEAEDGTLLDILVQDGEIVGDPARTFKVVTLGFLLDGGDGWMNGVTFTDRVNLFDPASSTAFDTAGREQRVLADYLAANFATPATAYDQPDTEEELDARIQNLDFGDDGVLPQATVQYLSGGTAMLDGTVTAVAGLGTALTFTASGRVETIAGTDANDIILAGGSRDSVAGGLGADSLLGEAGKDSMQGGDRADTLDGGSGIDILDGGDGDDVLLGGTGGELLLGGLGDDLLDGGSGDELGFGGAGRDTLLGGGGLDILEGEEGDDSLSSGTSADTLDGGLGADVMVGATGNDLYVVDDAGDVVTEIAGGGRDLVRSAVDLTLGAFVEDLTLVGSAVSGTGNARSNAILGNELANLLSGGGGADTLSGAEGNDQLAGGGNNDLLVGGAGGDTLAGGAGNDVFAFLDTADSAALVADGGDLIEGFVRGEDRIRLGFDFDEATPGFQSFDAAEHTIHVDILDPTLVVVSIGTDADAERDFILTVRGAGTLDATDFVFA
jgi:2',3'-cyclic-nucleotide 2'-phosphodiesterase (5'-nucleotidase family)/DNA-binding beta-propeller fold protein YncE